MVEELARNHLTQQELDEDEPARIFGQQVESDSIKRKREEVVLSELELQLAEQAGALKRRRIESIQYCLEALAEGVDDRDRIRSTDMIREVAYGSSSASTESQSADREICIREVVNAAGRARESPGIDMKVGKLAKKLLLLDDPSYVFPRKRIFAGGQAVDANVWRQSQCRYIDAALAQL